MRCALFAVYIPKVGNQVLYRVFWLCFGMAGFQGSYHFYYIKICLAFFNALQQDTCKHLLRRHGQVSVKVFDYLAKQVAIVIPLTAPSMRRTRCKRKVEVLTLFNQFFS